MNPRSHADVMVLAHEDEAKGHPFCYARILGVFHVNVVDIGHHSQSQAPARMDLLWVRWFTRDLTYKAGRKKRRLHRVQFLPDTDPDAFGFLDPHAVIRGAHIIPGFAHGKTSSLLRGPSIARPVRQLNDHKYYYINQ